MSKREITKKSLYTTCIVDQDNRHLSREYASRCYWLHITPIQGGTTVGHQMDRRTLRNLAKQISAVLDGGYSSAGNTWRGEKGKLHDTWVTR